MTDRADLLKRADEWRPLAGQNIALPLLFDLAAALREVMAERDEWKKKADRIDGTMVFAAPDYVGALADRARRCDEAENDLAAERAKVTEYDFWMRRLSVAISDNEHDECMPEKLVLHVLDLKQTVSAERAKVEAARSALRTDGRGLVAWYEAAQRALAILEKTP